MEIEGLDELLHAFENSSNNFNREAERTIDRIGNKLLRKVKLKTPVAIKNGGTLRRNWQFDSNGLEGIVANNTEYGVHVEYGHRTRSGSMVEGKYMLTKSVEEMQNEIDHELEIMIDNLFR